MREASLFFLKALVGSPSPSGYEQPVAREFRRYSEAFADEVSTDILGNVTAVLNPYAGRRTVLLAHMDEIGFIVHFISDEGLLYFSPIGGHDSVVPAGQRVWVHGRDKTPGVIGRAEFNLMTSEKKEAKPQLGELWIDIGARSRREAEDHVAVGDVVSFQYEFQKLLGDRAASRAFDNKAGLWAMAEALRLLKEEGGLSPDVGVYAVGTVQEEIGSRGAEVATRSISPHSGLAVDVGFARDHEAIDKRKSGRLEMGDGPGIACGPNANRVVFQTLSPPLSRMGSLTK